ncbi:PTS system mannose/fructose/sorbose family transporter subunit IID [Tetragenococcus koreensis]|uniref:PTS system mannose/fructose/sorbose family transporter subunit IID n=1 Tax=Tetragenococcus koreensis TaxID=290335 RepID=UPI001F3E6A16|nr:PTS system mannose/fructose/sorbose family transporter subunit IID [Tetragenococcus koreensis]MDN6730727.1 PTS system mannose/fructose/sorbose family transporter subunit IID [Atopostipes suicloacalis]MCF1585164.1 PTS system mannose/fructose/sorbose family transporter subunit IID [Tetragenococcus koreensis]MCF1614765.1 PTS system mannose/fructose/sorbose family transporter subunit IID [Tetragenococcus koreensis]MCF1618856.1 PTS system mannose/fructose/sorbose family transporter subunit IID [T
MDIKLTRKELIKNWALTYSSETAYNYERLQALGQANAMVPVIRKLYSDDKERQVKELKKYFVFYNTEPSFIGTMIPGVAAAMEEQRANGAEDITDETINSLRTGLMGPVAGIGDTVSQGIVYPILAGIACSLAIDGSYVGPIFFEIAYKVLLIGFGWNMYRLGYQKGKTFILTMLKEGTISRLTEIFSMIGLMVVGCMTAERVDIESPFILNIRGVELNIQEDVLDALMPGLIPLGITMFVYWLVRKKVNINLIILTIFVAGILLSYLNILGVPAE